MPTAWLQTHVVVPHALAEGVANVLIELGSPGLTSEETAAGVSLLAYFDSDRPLAALRRYLTDVAPASDVTIDVRWIGSENWAENWKEHFPPIDIGRRFHVCPPWRVSRPPNRIVIAIDPGMAFGTGHHVTTMGCLELLEQHTPEAAASALDVGCGSGILTIALAKLGVRHVVAVDVDPLARAATAENWARNGVEGAVTILGGIADVERKPFPLVVANLQLGALCEIEPAVRERTKPGSRWIASGLLQTDLAGFRDAWKAHWAECDRIDGSEWVSLALRRKP